MKIIFLLLLSILNACTFFNSNTNGKLSEAESKAEIYYSQGTNDLVAQDYPQALINLTKAKEYNPNDSKIRNNLGMALYFKGRFDLAEKEILKAIDLDSKNSDAKVNLGSLYFYQKKYAEAKKKFLEVYEDLTYTKQFRNLLNLAQIYLKEGDRKEAIKFINLSIKEKEDYCAAHFKLGEMYYEESRFKEAYKSFLESGKGTCVKDVAPLFWQGQALLGLEKNNEAKIKFNEVVNKFPDSELSKKSLKILNNMSVGKRNIESKFESNSEVEYQSKNF